MGNGNDDWSDDDTQTTKVKSAETVPKQKGDDDWEDEPTISANADHGGSSNRGRGNFRGGRGRGGGSFGDRGDRQDRDGGFRGRGRGGSRTGDRPRRDDDNGDGEPKRDYSERRQKNGDDDDTEKKEEKPREKYIPPEPTEDESEIFGNAIQAGINFDLFDKIEVNVSGEDGKSIQPLKSFKESGLRDFLLTNVEKSGYTKPTPIQKHAIPIILAKRDLMGCAQTGSGKTAAFVLPILDAIMTNNETMSIGQPQCLIVAPTRELVIQIFDEARKFALSSWVKINLAYGGTSSQHQSDRISKGCHVLVATPGRLMDFVNKGVISFESLKFLVLDEADRMLDMGFKDTIHSILNHETLTKDNVQVLMFSATFPEAIQRLAGQYLKNYLFLTVGIVGGASTDVEQEILEVTKFKKRDKLKEIIQGYSEDSDDDRILVFVDTKKQADFLASYMSEVSKLSSTSIHGDRMQRERELALSEFRSGKRKLLIATSVAARGLDIKGVTHVINYDIPKDIQDYVHRIGRTGRVGNRGKSTSFFDPKSDSGVAADLVRILQEANQPIPQFLKEFGSGTSTGDAFGGEDIRAGVEVGKKQEEDEDW